jgi:dienelactone hydrolase
MLLPVLLLLAAQGVSQNGGSPNEPPPNTDTHFALPRFTTIQAWEKRKSELRRQILFAAGLDPMPEKTPLHAQVFGRIETKDCAIEKVLIETMPGYFLGGNLYRPLHATGRHPAVLNPHGHWTYGRLENQPLYSGPNLGANLARQGYVVFAWDMAGYNDTGQTPHAFGGPAEQLWSFGPFGLQAWNSLRALDFVAGLEDVDASRIGMTGASGGATQTLMLAAMDDRVSYFAPVNMISAYMQGGDFCENAPGLRFGTNNVEIAAMIAPKPLLMVSATGDWTKNTPTEEYPAIRRLYELYGKPENIETLQLDAPHNFNKQNREAVYRFFGKHMLHDPHASAITEKNAEVPMLQNMLALSGRSLPSGALKYEDIFAEWKHRNAPRNAREALSLALAAQWPEQMSLDGSALDGAGEFREGKGVPVIVVGGSMNDAPAGRPAVLIGAIPQRDHTVKHFLTFNKSDDALRVQQVLTAMAWLHKKYAGPVEVIGIGTAAGVCAKFAAAVAPIPVKLAIDISAFHGADEDFLKYFNVPGIQTAGGLTAAERLTQ